MTEKENPSQFDSQQENTSPSDPEPRRDQPDNNQPAASEPSPADPPEKRPESGDEAGDKESGDAKEENQMTPETPPAPATEQKPASDEQPSPPDDRQVMPSVPSLQNQSSPPGQVSVPVNDDAEIEKEIQESLGDVSLMDMYSDLDEDTDQTQLLTDSLAGQELGEDKLPGINKGKVIGVADDGVFIDLGGKSQGFLPKEEIEEGEKIEVGMNMDVSILRYDARDGLLILSRKEAQQQLLRRNLKEGAMVEARVVGTNKGGLEMDIKGLRAFMPVSQIDIGRIEDMEPLIGERLVCEVLQVERGDKNIVLSRRNLLLKEEEDKRRNFWETIENGEIRHGKVRSIADYGAFVDLGGVDGLLHVSELSWARVAHPKDVLSVGQDLTVKVISIDRETQRIGLSVKQAAGDPWATVEQRYQVGGRYQAQATKLMDFGAFAELEPGVEGLIPISEMSWVGRIKHPSEVIQVGQMAEVEIIKLDVNQRRISMSMKKVQENPWGGVDEKYPKDSVVKGKVARLTDFGAFITLEPGVDGLIHISELSDKHVAKVSDVLSEGEEVEVKILNVDPDNQRIGLTMKGLIPGEEAVADQAESTAADDEAKKAAKKRKRPLRGGLTWGSQDIFKL